MLSVYDSINRLIAHRGASGHAPENTEAAIRLAKQKGANWAEVDVALSADGQAIIFHDHTLNRCTNGQGLVIKHSLEELKLLNAGSWYSPFYSKEKILTLKELLQLANELELNLNLELKPTVGYEKETLLATKEALKNTDFHYQILISSFNALALKKAQKYLPQYERGLNVEAIPGDWQKRMKKCGATGLHFEVDFFDPEQTKSISEQGIPLLCFTVNTPEVAKPLWDSGVKAVFTDYLDRFSHCV